jgi:subtilisin family serine protease
LGHGTNVSGIIGANGNNATGYAGVDWNCKLMNLKALNSNNFGYYSWWADAIYYAVDNGAKIINMSLSGTGYSSTLQNAINYALSQNVTVVAAMSNENSSTVNYPAGFPGVIAVGSTDPNDTRSNPFFWSATSGSNYGSHISVVAPGNYIFGLNYQSNTNYDYYYGGTSQATPHVTGLAALLLAGNASLKPDQIKTIIEITAEDRVGNSNEDSPGWDQYYGYGRINAFKALSLSPSFWTGSVSSDWETAGNWSSNSVPGENTDVIIPNTYNKPVINLNTAVNKIFVLKNAAVTINPGIQLIVKH